MRKYEENALYWKIIGNNQNKKKIKKGKSIGPQVKHCLVLDFAERLIKSF